MCKLQICLHSSNRPTIICRGKGVPAGQLLRHLNQFQVNITDLFNKSLISLANCSQSLKGRKKFPFLLQQFLSSIEEISFLLTILSNEICIELFPFLTHEISSIVLFVLENSENRQIPCPTPFAFCPPSLFPGIPDIIIIIFCKV